MLIARFTLDELLKFTEIYFERQQNNHNTVDIVKEFQGYCTMTYSTHELDLYVSHSLNIEECGTLSLGLTVHMERRDLCVGSEDYFRTVME